VLSGATTTNLTPGVLYRVKATYKYVQEDGDELSFDVGDIVNVVEYDDPEDQVCVLMLVVGLCSKVHFSHRRKAG
jgi:SH3 domain